MDMVPSWNSKNHGYSMLLQLLWTKGHRKLAMDQHHDPNENMHWNAIQIHDIPVKPMKYCTLEIEIQLTYEKNILYIYVNICINIYLYIYISNYMHIFFDTHTYIYTYIYIHKNVQARLIIFELLNPWLTPSAKSKVQATRPPSTLRSTFQGGTVFKLKVNY